MSEYRRFCNHCGGPVIGLRLLRNSHFCGAECRRADANARRHSLAERKCRLCGARRRTKAKKLDTVRDAHTQPEMQAQ